MPKNYSQSTGLVKGTRIKGTVMQNLIAGFLIILFLLPVLLKAQNKVQGEKFIIEPPTLENLGFEWYIEGDDNRNGIRPGGTQADAEVGAVDER